MHARTRHTKAETARTKHAFVALDILFLYSSRNYVSQPYILLSSLTLT